MPTQNNIRTLDLATRVSLEEKRREQEMRLASLNSRRAADHAEGREAMARQVADSLQAIAAWEAAPPAPAKRRVRVVQA